MVLEGEIIVDVSVNPRTLSFGQLSKGDTGTKEFFVTVAEPDKIKITSVSIEDKRFELRTIDKTAGKYEVAFKGSKTIERLSTNVHITYDGSDVNSIDVPVRANVVGNLRYPRNVFFLRRGGEFKPRDIAITTRAGNSIKIKNANDPSKNLKLTVTTATGQRTVVRAEVAEPDKKFAAPVEGNIVIKTSDKDEPEVQIVYRISESLGRRMSLPGASQLPLKKKPGNPPNPK